MDNLGPSQKYDFYKAGVSSGYQGMHSAFMGPPPREEKLNAWEQRSHAKWNMPDAYLGINKTMRDTMEDYMLTAEFDWPTERIMPWYKTDDIHFQWTEWENNPHYLGITPHQTASRVVTQKRTIRRASIVRRGIAFEFEHDFVATALGRSSFMAGFGQMARSVQETGNVEVIRSLLHCHHRQHAYIRKYGIIKDFELDEWHERRADRFMCAQKNDFGLEKLSTQIEAEQETYGAKADVWILDRAVIDYVDTVPENRTLYYKGGQEAVDRINARPNGTQAAGGTMGNLRRLDPEGMIRNTPVFIAKSYHVEGLGKEDLLARVTEIGVYNTMIDRCTDFFDYKSVSRKIRVYDNDIDNWSDIEFEYALRNCGIWDPSTGKLREIYNSTGTRSHAAAKDADYDFLSYNTTQGRRNIERVGDISLNYQTEHDMIDGAKSLLTAAVYGDKDAATAAMKAYANNKATLDDGFVKAVNNLAGKNNLFAGALVDNGQFSANFANLNSALAFPVQSATGVAVSGSNDTVEQMDQKFVANLLGAPLPSSYQARVAEIAANTDIDWKIRANTVKDMVLDALKADPNSVQAVKTPADVDKWYSKNMAQFEQKRNAKLQSAESVSSKADGKYFSVDAPLPAGYRWANPNEVRQPALARMPAFQDYLRATAPVAQRDGAGFRARARIGHGAGATMPGGPYDRSDQHEEAMRQDAQNRARDNRITFGQGSVFGNIATLINRIAASGAHPLLKALAVIYAGTSFERDVLCNYAKNNVAVKIGLLLMRPHCTYRTKYGIKCLSGGGAGYTFFGHSDMQIEHEAARKVGMAHYTTYLSAVVLYPKNVYVVEDLYCEKYLGGMGVEFWTPERYTSGAKRNTYDIICAPLPPSRKRVEQKIDVRGRWYTEMSKKLVSQERFDQPLYESCGRINKLYRWYDESRKDRVVSRSRVPPNYVCWQGMQWHYNAKLERFDDYIIESGCMGHNVGPGVGKVRNGGLHKIPEFNYHAMR